MRKLTLEGKLIVFILVFVVLIASAILIQRHNRNKETPKNVDSNIEQILLSGLSENFDVNTGLEETGIVEEKIITLNDLTGDVDRFLFLVNEKKNVIDIQLPSQPTKPAGDYKANTSQLNVWLKQNLQSFTAPDNVNGGYLYVALYKPLKFIGDGKTKQTVVISTSLRNNGWGIYGRLLVKDAIQITDTEYLFPLDSVKVNNSKGDDRVKLLKGQEVYIGAFVGAYDNGVSNITLVRF